MKLLFKWLYKRSGKSIQDNLLQEVTSFYLNSRDFNGISIFNIITRLKIVIATLQQALIPLVEQDKISLVFGDSHPNPHIKAFKEEASDKQIEKIKNVELLEDACVYPSPSHLKQVVDVSEYQERPFTLRLALGEPQLAFESFDLRVLEDYRNDPRYYYTCDDVDGMISVSDKYYESEEMASHDQVLLQTFGFSYDENLNRAVAVFLCYLSDLSPEHQQIWNARVVKGDYKLHPNYAASSMGYWPETVPIFEAFAEEIHTINEMAKLMGRPVLFKREVGEEKPRGFSFLIRPTLKEYNDFIHLLDKLISDNLNKKFFLDDVPLETEEERNDGKIVIREKGTIQILSDWLSKMVNVSDKKPLEEMLDTFKKIRKERQHPAHAIEDDIFDQKYFEKQRHMMIKAYEAVRTLRLLFANHSKAKAYEVPDWLYNRDIVPY